MTGSGKTGLCLALLEEAAIDGIPAIVIDPKGDLANLLLTFPDSGRKTSRRGSTRTTRAARTCSVDDYARQQAELWKKGLADWGQDGARIQRLRDAADFAIYTPGSNAGIPLSILKSFAAPPPGHPRGRASCCASAIGTTATSLLGLLGIDADPIQSREHILLSTILGHGVERRGRTSTWPALIQQIQTPPVKRVGVLDLEAFFPAKERFALAMPLNNLLASPGFDAWMEGEPLDIGNAAAHARGQAARRDLLDRAPHRRRADVLRLAAAQPGARLDAHAARHDEPARAALHGRDLRLLPAGRQPAVEDAAADAAQAGARVRLGVVLATQNPVDLDYKGLANAGTWFIGRLQTERDKARVLDGLEGAAGSAGQGFDRGRDGADPRRALGNRVFLMNNVHEDDPVVFETRWAMSYLRGPLTRAQIKTLMDARRARAGRTGRRQGALGGNGQSPPRRHGRPRPGPRATPRPPPPARASARCSRPTCRSTSCRPAAARPPAARCSTSRCSSGPPRCACPTPRTRST